MADVAKAGKVPLAVRADTLDELAALTESLTKAGLEDLVLDPGVTDAKDSLEKLTWIRRLAVKKNVRALGFPMITFPGADGKADEVLLAAEHIAKYAGFIVLEKFDPASLYGLLVLRQNIYTDPQKPIQVQPGLYEINNPKQLVARDGDDQLLDHLLRCRQRGRGIGLAGVAGGDGRRGHERSHRLGRRQVRLPSASPRPSRPSASRTRSPTAR